MSDYLPPEAVMNILSRLPPESLLRFRCVCKPWRTLISTPNFIATHLNRTQTNHLAPKLLFIRYKSSPSRSEQISLRFDNDSFNVYAKFKCPFEAKVYFRIVGICNGLICLSDDIFGYTYTVIIWNPAIHRYLSLPKPSFNIDNCGPYMFALGFGFDVKRNDYKVVRLAYLEKTKSGHGDHYFMTPKVEIYSVGTCKWRTMKRGVPAVGIVECIWTQVFLNGSVHWAAYKVEEEGLRNVVLCFDMSEEKFNVMGLPDVFTNVSPVNFSIGIHRESLALFAFDNRRRCTSLSVYVMKEYGQVGSWSEMLRVSDIEGGIRTVPGFREDGDLLVLTKADELVSYDPILKITKKLGVRGVRESVYAGSYAESLVLLNESKGKLASQVKTYKKSVPLAKQWRQLDERRIEKRVAATYVAADRSLPYTANSGVDYDQYDEQVYADTRLMMSIYLDTVS